ncbi:hypothetical protein BC936DRAFT_143667, partial [Jimgerdemannia flammicorona]
MVEVFGAELLGAMHNDIMQRLTKQELEFDAEVAIKLTCTIKHLQREEITRDIAVSELQSLMTGRAYEECAILKAIKNIIERVPRATLKSPVGEVELCTTYIDPVLSPIIADPERGVFLRCSTGQHISFYLTTLLYDGLYVMTEIGHLNMPVSLEQLPAFLTSLDTLLIVSNAYWANCVQSSSTVEMEPNKRSTLATPNFKELIAKNRDRH